MLSSIAHFKSLIKNGNIRVSVALPIRLLVEVGEVPVSTPSLVIRVMKDSLLSALGAYPSQALVEYSHEEDDVVVMSADYIS